MALTCLPSVNSLFQVVKKLRTACFIIIAYNVFVRTLFFVVLYAINIEMPCAGMFNPYTKVLGRLSMHMNVLLFIYALMLLGKMFDMSSSAVLFPSFCIGCAIAGIAFWTTYLVITYTATVCLPRGFGLGLDSIEVQIVAIVMLALACITGLLDVYFGFIANTYYEELE